MQYTLPRSFTIIHRALAKFHDDGSSPPAVNDIHSFLTVPKPI